MYPPPAPLVPGQPIVKPSLQGVRNKQRKGVQKANAKHEPLLFRDQLTKHLEAIPAGDFDAVAAKLDALGNSLDYRKYEQELFEILLVGGLLAPGGALVDDGAAKSPFSVLGSSKDPVEVGDMKKIVDVFNKLLRRYKYLQKVFEESSLKGIIQYTNKFPAADQEKLAVATAVFVSAGLAPASILGILTKDHIIKDSTSLNFLTRFLKAYLQVESIEYLSSSLRKGGVADLSLFFPVPRQTTAELTAHFKGEGLVNVLDFYTRQKANQASHETLFRLKELVAEESDDDEIIQYLQQQAKTGILAEADMIVLVWNGLMTAVDMSANAGVITDAAVKEITRVAPILAVFCKKAATEVALINTIQIWCYENTKLIPAFAKILKVLYGKDVLSDQAVIYWHSKGSKVQGRVTFLAAADPLVAFLKEQDEESEEEDDE